MAYNPRQPRDRMGRWARSGSIRRIARAAAVGAIVGGGPSGALAAASGVATKEAVRGTKTVVRRKVAQSRRAPKVTKHAKTKMPGKDYIPIGDRRARGVGVSGLKKNTIPYVRANKRSQTVGVNAGTIIPGTSKRVVIGGYARIESTTRETAVDRALASKIASVAPKGSRRAKVVSFGKNLDIKNPAIRASAGGAQVRLGTSRGAGPTVIVRRGKHRIAQSKSKAGVQKFDSRMSSIAGKRTKPPRPQRRRAARRRK